MALRSYSVAVRRRERSGRRRMVVSSAALLVVAAVGLTAVYGSIAPGTPQRQPAPGAALAVTGPADDASNDDAVIRFAAVVAMTSAPVSQASVTPHPTTPEPASLERVTPEPASLERVTPEPATARPASLEPAAPDPLIAASSTQRGIAATADDGDAEADRGSDARAGDVTAHAGTSPVPSGWVCGGEVGLEDPRGRRWSLGRASFRTGPGYERVVLHIDRLGPGNGAPASMTAEALSTARVRGSVPGARTPSSGQTTFSLHLAGPIEGNLGVRSFRPSGLRMLKEFSVYPAADRSSRVLASAASGDCFRVRVPAWTATGPNTRSAQIYLDIKS